jgi:hypothetical protein
LSGKQTGKPWVEIWHPFAQFGSIVVQCRRPRLWKNVEEKSAADPRIDDGRRISAYG